MQRFNLKNLNDVYIKGKHQVKNDDDDDDDDYDDDDDNDVNRAWESITETMKVLATQSVGYYKLKQHKPWSDEECSKLLHQRKQAKLQWLQNPSQTSADNLNNVKCETSRTLRNKRRNI
jgi:hypothetical protein